MVFAQDTVSLKDVEISAKKIELSELGKKTEEIDSTAKEHFKFTSVADLLGYNSSVFIKNYSPGGIATTGFRGGNASQTAVLWNGFNLQNAMLGQADLALMPTVLFEDVAVEYGGSSSHWGSGAIAGSIHLNNKLNFDKGLTAKINFGAGSFGTINGSANILVSKKRFVSSTKIYNSSSRNDFRYRDTLDRENPYKRQKDADYRLKGLMQEFRVVLSSKQIVSINAWLSASERHLPIFNPAFKSKTYQWDNAARVSANWSYVEKRFRSIVRGAYFADEINYVDSISNIYSKSIARTTMLENENYFSLTRHYQLSFALNALSSSAATRDYSSSKTLNRASLLLGNKFNFFKDRLLIYISARAEYFSVGSLPVTGNTSAEFRLSRFVTMKLNCAKVYRQPTLNELYWVPGGNFNLKPEEGYTSEGEINYNRQYNVFLLSVSGSAYTRVIDNWILWVPGANGNPSPLNIQKVWSRGTETSWKIRYTKNKWRAGTSVITGYALSTVQANNRQNDNSLNKQLIYTPRYTVNGSASVGYDQADLVFYHQYSGYRFTTSDNLHWLAPYHVSSLRFSYKINPKNLTLAFFAAINNVFNSDYTVIAGQPMPLRNYQFGITIHSNPVKKQNQL